MTPSSNYKRFLFFYIFNTEREKNLQEHPSVETKRNKWCHNSERDTWDTKRQTGTLRFIIVNALSSECSVCFLMTGCVLHAHTHIFNLTVSEPSCFAVCLFYLQGHCLRTSEQIYSRWSGSTERLSSPQCRHSFWWQPGCSIIKFTLTPTNATCKRAGLLCLAGNVWGIWYLKCLNKRVYRCSFCHPSFPNPYRVVGLLEPISDLYLTSPSIVHVLRWNNLSTLAVILMANLLRPFTLILPVFHTTEGNWNTCKNNHTPDRRTEIEAVSLWLSGSKTRTRCVRLLSQAIKLLTTCKSGMTFCVIIPFRTPAWHARTLTLN